jgi:hypothetical protein
VSREIKTQPTYCTYTVNPSRQNEIKGVMGCRKILAAKKCTVNQSESLRDRV